jgi:CRISPR system Cascade subunit CasE
MALEQDLYLVRLELDAARLFQRVRGLPPRQLDTGYLVHGHLAGLFGELGPRPFRILEGRGRRVQVWGYAACGRQALLDHAQAYADPLVFASCDWDRFETKPVPAGRWLPGRRAGFEVRICPVVRTSREGAHGRKPREVDLFLSRSWAAGSPDISVDREGVYRDWLAERLAQGGAKLLEARMQRFRRVRLLRRKQDAERTATILERPDATFEGTLEVTDGAAFAALLARGVGRHRAFGFGMLLLRPPRRADS